MSKISKEKIEKIKQDILYLLYESGIRPRFTKEIADELARDDEFILKLLRDLEKDGLIRQTNKKDKRRRKWVMVEDAYKEYQKLV